MVALGSDCVDEKRLLPALIDVTNAYYGNLRSISDAEKARDRLFYNLAVGSEHDG